MAYKSLASLTSAFSPAVYPWYLVMALPFVLHLIATLRNQTCLPRWTVLAHPVLWYAAISLIAKALPASPFSSALQMGAMSESMLVWFVVALLCKSKT